MEQLEAVLKRSPDYVEALKVKAALHAKNKEFDQAIATYEHALDLEEHIDTYCKLAEILLETEKYFETIELVHRAFRLRLQSMRLYIHLAQACHKTRQVTKAYLLYSKALRLGLSDPDLKKAAQKCKLIVIARHEVVKKIALKAAS